VIKASGDNPSSWAASRHIDKKRVQRAMSGDFSTTLDVIADLAKAAGLEPWQLLLPGLDPSNPPVFTMTKAERDLYVRVRMDFANLPSANGGK
jgi:hypothetical protein